MLTEIASRWNAVFGGAQDKAVLVREGNDARLRALRARRGFQEALDEVPCKAPRRAQPVPTNGLGGEIDEEERLVREALGG
jgi:hypothetical protein